jgi:hypothetical protein
MTGQRSMWLAASLLLAPVLLPTSGSEAAASSADETRAEFEDLCQRLTRGDNYFFGQAALDGARSVASTPSTDPRRQVAAELGLGYELVRLGRHEEAIELLGESLQATTEAGIPEDDPLSLAALSMLGVAHLQLSEDENCIGFHSPGSCILPIVGDAVHRLPEHSKAAGDLFQRYLSLAPDDIQIRWLLNLARMISGAFPEDVPESWRVPLETFTPTIDFPHWRDIASDLGVSAFDLAGGAVMDDFDGDGLLDLVSTSWDPCEPMKAFRNDGQGGFEDVAQQWGLDAQWGGLNLLQVDFDNDGALDLQVMRGGWMGSGGRLRNSLLRNRLAGPEGRFVDVTSTAGLAYPAYPSHAAVWSDFDSDGDLDLFVGNEAGSSTYMTAGNVGEPYPSQLFRNNGDGTFTDIARRAGVDNQRFAKGAAWGDYDNDGDPDLYVSNFAENRLYRNNGDGTFSDTAPELGVIEPAAGSFATWFFDYNNDGHLDILVTDYTAPMADVSAALMGLPTSGGNPILYRNDGGTFTDVSAEVGLVRPHLPMGANYGDLDNDGWLDFYLGTGIPNFEALMPNAMYWNRQGERFDDVSLAGGFAHLQKGHGVAFGDVDNDGDQDLFHQLGGAFPFDGYGNALFENPGNGNHWLTLRLEGRGSNRRGVGARITVVVRGNEAPRQIHRLVGIGGSFGGSSLQQEIGLGKADTIERLTIDWPGTGNRSTFSKVDPDRFYLAVEGESELRPLQVPKLHLQPRDGRHRHASQGHRP